MMYDELVKLARHCSEVDACINCPVSGCEGTTGIMNRLADAIEELIEVIQNHDFLESLIKPRWIPVTERLPSPMKAVLVWTPYKRNIFMAYLQSNKWYVWGPNDICCHNWPEYHAITHWMPLPEPPKEE